MDYKRAYRELSRELEEQGYKCRLDEGHVHPRMYISDGLIERFVALSKSQNYDQNGMLHMKRNDIKKELGWLNPKPKKPNGEAPTAPPPEPVPARLSQGKITLHKGGNVAVYLNKDAVPEDRQEAVPGLTDDGRLMLTFYKEGGKSPGKVGRADDIVVYIFPRTDFGKLPLAEKSPEGYSAERMPGKLNGNCFIFEKPFPKELYKQEVKAVEPSATDDIDDGRAVLAMFNEWLEKARAAGLEPELKMSHGKLKVTVTEKRRTDL